MADSTIYEWILAAVHVVLTYPALLIAVIVAVVVAYQVVNVVRTRRLESRTRSKRTIR